MNVRKKMIGLKWPVETTASRGLSKPGGYRTVKEAYDYENLAAVAIILNKKNKTLIHVSYADACRFVLNKEFQKELSKLKELK